MRQNGASVFYFNSPRLRDCYRPRQPVLHNSIYSDRKRYTIDEMHVFVLSASTLEATTGTLVTLLSALLSTTQCRSELNITQLDRAFEWADPNHAYHCYAGHGYFADTRFLAKHVPDARFVLNTRRVDNWVAAVHQRYHLRESLLYARVKEVMFVSNVLHHYFRNKDNFIAMRVEDFELLSQGDYLFNLSPAKPAET